MARIPLVDPNDDSVEAGARETLERVSRGAYQPNVYRAIANHPRVLEAMGQFGSAVYFDNGITPAQRELAYLTASVVNNCHY